MHNCGEMVLLRLDLKKKLFCCKWFCGDLILRSRCTIVEKWFCCDLILKKNGSVANGSVAT